MEFKGIEERVKDSVGSEILKRHMSAASEKRNKGADITKRALSGGLPTPTTTERPTQALGGKPVSAFGNQILQEGITRNALKGSSSQIKNFMEGTPPPSQDRSSQVPTFNADQFRKDIVNNSMQKNLQERGSILAPGGKITKKSEQSTDNRNVELVNANGVVQKGTSTSPSPMTMDDANKLLSGGYNIENPYSSNQLPTTASSPYAGKSNSQIYNPDTLHQHNSDVDYVSLSKNLDADKSGVETYQRGKNMKADYKQMDVNPGQNVPEEKINWANRTMADNSDEKVRRRSAMLDGNVGIMQAMRNQEAIQGRVYAGGKHWQRNKDAGQEGQNDFVEISGKQANDRSYYRQSADEVFANHLGKAKEKTSGADLQTVSQNAPAMLPDAVPGQTPMDKSPFDTQDLMQQKPGKSIIGNNTPYTSANPATLFR
jgi:hypothetical protein